MLNDNGFNKYCPNGNTLIDVHWSELNKDYSNRDYICPICSKELSANEVIDKDLYCIECDEEFWMEDVT